MTKFSEIMVSPLRAGAAPETLKALFGKPMLFAAHYAVVHEFIELPKEIEAVLATVRTRYDAHLRATLKQGEQKSRLGNPRTGEYVVIDGSMLDVPALAAEGMQRVLGALDPPRVTTFRIGGI